MIESLRIKNYRSIVDATVRLRPFTVLVGANGSGKSNLLRLLTDLGRTGLGQTNAHLAHTANPISVEVACPPDVVVYRTLRQGGSWIHQIPHLAVRELDNVVTFTINPLHVGQAENLAPSPTVGADGRGAVQVLDSLKTGDREDLFRIIEQKLREFVPEIEKLSFAPGSNTKSLQVREAGIPTPIPVSELSEGTRLVLTILTIVYQEQKPSIIAIEDLDRGLHPSLFGKVVDVCRRLVKEPGAPQIIATTHNPYLVDQFIDDEDSVILVEKKDSTTTFTSLSERMKGLDRGSEPLGGVWYSGLVGGVPASPVAHVPPDALTGPKH